MSEAKAVFEKAVGFVVESKRLGVRRKVSTADVGTDADKSMLYVSKAILESDELKRVQTLDNKLRKFLTSRCLPSFFKAGVWLLPVTLIEEVDAEFEKFRSDRAVLVDEFLSVYEQRCTEARQKLGSLFSESDYPPIEKVRGSFGLESHYIEFGTPENLKSIKADIFAREREKADQVWTNALEECRKLLRATMLEMVTHIQARLMSDDSGKKKSFHVSMFEKLDGFLTTFANRNIADDAELQGLVSDAQEAMVGVEPSLLRTDDAMRDAVRTKFGELKTKLDTMVVDRPSRAFDAA